MAKMEKIKMTEYYTELSPQGVENVRQWLTYHGLEDRWNFHAVLDEIESGLQGLGVFENTNTTGPVEVRWPKNSPIFFQPEPGDLIFTEIPVI